MARGKFIVLEGIDGAGTSTQSANLKTYIDHKFGECLLEHEPSGLMNPPIRDHIARGTGQDEMAVLFTADRIRHSIELLEPALEDGIHVVCDRYSLSTLVYQTHGRPSYEHLLVRKLVGLGGLSKPDLVLLVDLDAEVAAQRMGGRVLDRYEKDSVFQSEIREAYRTSALQCGYPIINGSLDEQTVAAAIQDHMWKLWRR